MARSLVIVESPAKAKTINKYLGRNYNVKASYGHVMDLPKKTIGILLPEQTGPAKRKVKRSKKKGKAAEKASAKKPVKVVPIDSEEAFDPTYEVIPSKFKVVERSAQSGAGRRRHLSGGRPGPRRRSDLRAPGADPEQAAEEIGSCRTG